MTHILRKIIRFSLIIGFFADVQEKDVHRDKDRERAAARNQKGKSGKEDGLTPEQRRERDAKALQEKTAKKAEQSGSGGGGVDSKNKAGSKK